MNISSFQLQVKRFQFSSTPPRYFSRRSNWSTWNFEHLTMSMDVVQQRTMSMDVVQQRAVIHFMVLQKKEPKDVHVATYGDNAFCLLNPL